MVWYMSFRAVLASLNISIHHGSSPSEVGIGELREVLTGWLCRTDATAICENLEW